GSETRSCCSRFGVGGFFDDVALSAWAGGIDAMFRFTLLKSTAFPIGQLQPYITVGPAVFMAHAEDSDNFVPSNQHDRDTALGVKVGAVVAWHFTKLIAMFGEYRYTHFRPEFTFVDNAGGITDLSSDVNTNSVLVGVSFRF